MKMSPEYTKAQQNMQPGEITADGFLGGDDRPLVDVIAADEEAMERLGLDFELVAKKLQELFEKGRSGLGEPVTVRPHWIVKSDEARGVLPSPFEDGVFKKISARIELVQDGQRTGKFVTVTPLSLHLMVRHHFLQGKGSPFRLDPRTVSEVLYPDRR